MKELSPYPERLSALLVQIDLNPNQFAKRIGMPHQNISNILTGRNKPGVETLAAIAGAFPGFNTNWLLTGTGAAFPDGIYKERPAPDQPDPLPPAGSGGMKVNRTGDDPVELRRELAGALAELRTVRAERDRYLSWLEEGRQLGKNLGSPESADDLSQHDAPVVHVTRAAPVAQRTMWIQRLPLAA